MRYQLGVRRGAAWGALTVGLALGLGGCSAGSSADPPVERGSHTSRVKLYPSVRALASDSKLVVIGEVSDQRVAADITPDFEFTISTVSITDVVKGADSLAPGQAIQVRQVGSATQAAPAPLMTPGSSYLLYLTPSGLPGELAGQYYVTGGNAGLYSAPAAAAAQRGAPGSAAPFDRVQAEPGEQLPNQLTPGQALG